MEKPRDTQLTFDFSSADRLAKLQVRSPVVLTLINSSSLVRESQAKIEREKDALSDILSHAKSLSW